MADIELVIKIPEELYKSYKGRPPMLGDVGMDMIAQSIANGTPLPKGHGDLIDKSELKEHLYACETNGRPLYVMELHERLATIDEVETIIEADKEREDKE